MFVLMIIVSDRSFFEVIRSLHTLGKKAIGSDKRCSLEIVYFPLKVVCSTSFWVGFLWVYWPLMILQMLVESASSFLFFSKCYAFPFFITLVKKFEYHFVASCFRGQVLLPMFLCISCFGCKEVEVCCPPWHSSIVLIYLWDCFISSHNDLGRNSDC
jgi:hypothetical protein